MRVSIKDEHVFDAPPIFVNGYQKQILNSKGSTTPTVFGIDCVNFQNTSGVTVTNFLGGHEGQTIKCKGDGQTTITNGTNIFTSTGANKLLAANKVYTFTMFSNLWYEEAY